MTTNLRAKTTLALGPHQVPIIWKHMLPEDLQYMRFPSECKSTCSNCPKIKEENFHPDYRCCTYHPRVPNFLVGFALQDPETAPLFEKAISDGVTTPEGIQATAIQLRKSLQHAVTGDFGKLTTVVCRFLDVEKRQCGAYKYRNSVCSTFFCKNDHEKAGADFWDQLQSVAGQIETALSQWTMIQNGIDLSDYFKRFDSMAEDLEAFNSPSESWTDPALELLWGQWLGREREFFVKCADLVWENRDSLFEIAEKTEIQTAQAFDRKFRESLTPDLRKQLDSNHSIDGVPAPLSDLWYLFTKSHRDLWHPDR